PDVLVAEAEVQHRLVEAVLDLPEPYRSTVLYRWFEGLSAQEIAARFDLPVGTVRTRLKRAVARLRERMGIELGGARRAWALLVLGGANAEVVLAAKASASAPIVTAKGIVMGSTSKVVAAGVVLAIAAALLWTATRTARVDDAPAARTSAAPAPLDEQ